MIGRVNTGGGGGLNKSVIVVTAPSGSSVTCTNGTVTKKVEEKSGTWIFGGLSAGTWTINSILLTNSFNQNVIVKDGKFSYFVEVTYDLWLLKQGKKLVNFTETKSAQMGTATIQWREKDVLVKGTGNGTSTIFDVSILSDAFDFSRYSSLNFKMTGGQFSGFGSNDGASLSLLSESGNVIASKNYSYGSSPPSNGEEIVLPISSSTYLKGKVRIRVYYSWAYNAGQTLSLSCSDIWLTKD